MSDERRVVITGRGIVTALGTDEDAVWSAAIAGRSGIAPIRAFDVSAFKVKIGAEIDDGALAEAKAGRRWRARDRGVDLALLASAQALEQAGLVAGDPPYDPRPVPVIFGSGVGPAESLWTSYEAFRERGVRGLRPTTVTRCMANAFTAEVSIHFQLTGPNHVVVAACASSTKAIGYGLRMIRDGYAEQVLCGGVDAFFDPFYYGVWNNLGVLATEPDPAKAYRPFDADRTGCLLGEGAGAVLLESLASANDRGAKVRGEVLGFGESSDASHITAPSVDGQASAMCAALESAGVAPADLAYINAHGTATEANDVTESEAIVRVLGPAASRVPVGSSKAYFGHTLGASGVVETVVTLRGLEEGRVPANLNLDRPDPRCAVRLVGGEPLAVDGTVAMKNSFGFGGSNAVLVVRRFG